MTRDEIDIMWQKAMQEAVEDGEMYTRYRFARLLADAEREACAKICESYTDKSGSDHESHGYTCAIAIRARGKHETK